MSEFRLGRELADVAKLILDALRESCESNGIVSSYRPFLYHLSKNENGLTQSELVELIRFKAPTVSLTLQKMEYEGLVRKESDVNDQRVTRIYITEKGKALDDKVRAVHDELECYLANMFNDEEKENLIEYLERIQKKMEERKDK